MISEIKSFWNDSGVPTLDELKQCKSYAFHNKCVVKLQFRTSDGVEHKKFISSSTSIEKMNDELKKLI